MSANFLGREKGYQNVTGFSEGGSSVRDFFSPVDTYAERIDKLFEEIANMGYKGVDLWTAHCDPNWATPRHIDGVLAASAKHQVEIVSLAGSLSNDLNLIEQTCKLSQALDCPILGLGCSALPEKIHAVQQILERYDIRLAFENHPNEPTPQVVFDKIGNGLHPNIGVAFDTGWWATHNYPVLQALDELKEHILLVHLKNIQAPGAHVAARFDEGCLDLKPIVQRLRNIHYTGWISLEYEPLDHNPSKDCRSFLQTVTSWWHS